MFLLYLSGLPHWPIENGFAKAYLGNFDTKARDKNYKDKGDATMQSMCEWKQQGSDSGNSDVTIIPFGYLT